MTSPAPIHSLRLAISSESSPYAIGFFLGRLGELLTLSAVRRRLFWRSGIDKVAGSDDLEYLLEIVSL